MPRYTFRFGEFEGDESLPSLREFEDVAESYGIYGPSGQQRGAYRSHLGDDFFYMEFAKEVSEEILQIDEGAFNEEEISRARMMQFVVFNDGTYGYESRRGVYDTDAFDYLLTNYDFDYELKRYEQLSLNTMRKFYKESAIVKKIKADHIGEYEPNPHVTDEEIREITEDFGQHSRSIVASVGRTKENLKQARFIKDGIAKYSGLSMVKSVTRNDELRMLRDSGRFDFGVDTDKDKIEQAQEVRNTVGNFIRNIISDDEVENEDNIEDEN